MANVPSHIWLLTKKSRVFLVGKFHVCLTTVHIAHQKISEACDDDDPHQSCVKSVSKLNSIKIAFAQACDDDPHGKLVSEVVELNDSIELLTKKLNEAEDCRAQLVKARSDKDEDIVRRTLCHMMI